MCEVHSIFCIICPLILAWDLARVTVFSSLAISTTISPKEMLQLAPDSERLLMRR